MISQVMPRPRWLVTAALATLLLAGALPAAAQEDPLATLRAEREAANQAKAAERVGCPLDGQVLALAHHMAARDGVPGFPPPAATDASDDATGDPAAQQR